MKEALPTFCVVIPTFQEEKYLPHLLEDIKKQTIQPSQIIVADAGSTDKTREIARLFGCKVVKGGLPAKGRNNGAKYCLKNSELIFFLDADLRLPQKDTFQKILETYQRKRFDLAMPFGIMKAYEYEPQSIGKSLIVVLTNPILKYSFNKRENTPNRFAAGSFMVITTKWYKKLNGFDEFYKYGEDYDLFYRTIKQNGKFTPIKDVTVHYSARRLNFKYIIRLVLSGYLRKAAFILRKKSHKGTLKRNISQKLIEIAAKIYGIQDLTIRQS